MLLPDDPMLPWLKMLAYALFAAMGGILGHVMRAMDNRQKINKWRAALEGIGAGFVGLLVLFTCTAMNMSDQWTGVIVGVSGWMGANASIRILESLVYKKLGISQNPPAPLLERDSDNSPTNG